MDQNTFRHIVVMGVSGSGKTTVGEALSPLVGLEYRDGDDCIRRPISTRWLQVHRSMMRTGNRG